MVSKKSSTANFNTDNNLKKILKFSIRFYSILKMLLVFIIINNNNNLTLWQ